MVLATVTNLLLATLHLTGSLWPEQTDVIDKSYYDYLILGGGTSGCILARRLVDKGYSVLVLEAGDDPSVLSLLPGQFSSLPKTELDYDHQSTFDSYAASSQGNYTMLTAGKMLGGSAGLNHFIMIRGSPEDYDHWAEITGDSSWEYEEVLKYFIKSENVKDDDIVEEYGEYHGVEGPMGLSSQTHDSEVKKYLEALAEVGYPTVLDLNSNTTIGYTQPLLMIADGIRQTPAYSYLKAIKDDAQLYVSKNTRISRIIIENGTAIGAEAIYNNKIYTFYAKKEVILSAGVFNSPQILMLSGIGPKEHLESFGIDVIADLPLGDITDQVAVTLVYGTEDHLLALPDLKIAAALVPTEIPFPIIAGSATLDNTSTIADYQTYILILPHDTPFLTSACSNVFGYRTEICDRWKEQLTKRDAFYTILANVQPESRGSIRLASTDPFAEPLITTGYFTNKVDLDNMVAYIRHFNKINDSTYFKKIGAVLVGLDLPECSEYEADSDEFWKCYILHTAVSPYHAVGTCPMGSVVDGELKVMGVKNLRVVDASVMPKIPHSAPNSAVVMIAEKGADMILADAA